MPSARRIAVVAVDPTVRARLVASVAALTNDVDEHATLDAIPDGPLALCAVYLTSILGASPRLPAEQRIPSSPLVLVVAQADVAMVSELVQSDERNAGVIVGDPFDAGLLTAMARRIVGPEPSGIEALLAPGTAIHAQTVADYPAKLAYLAAMQAFFDAHAVPRRLREVIEQCVDEMLMNALYDAPLDARGKRLFEGVPPSARMHLRTEQTVAVRHAVDGTRVAVAVRDAFGSLERATVLRFLHKGSFSQAPVDRRAGGAGLGLYLMVHGSSGVTFDIRPGVATEVICVFDLRAPPRLEHFGVTVQPDLPGELPTPPARQLPVGGPSRRVPWIVALAIAGGLGIATVAWLRHTREVEPAAVSTRLETGTVDAAPAVSHVGWVEVRFVSNPPGARIVAAGEGDSVDHSYAPATVLVEPEREQHFVLTMPHHVPAVIEPFTVARGSGPIEKRADLPIGFTLTVESPGSGRATVVGVDRCRDLAVPAECVLAAGEYVVEVRRGTAAVLSRTVRITDRDLAAAF